QFISGSPWSHPSSVSFLRGHRVGETRSPYRQPPRGGFRMTLTASEFLVGILVVNVLALSEVLLARLVVAIRTASPAARGSRARHTSHRLGKPITLTRPQSRS